MEYAERKAVAEGLFRQGLENVEKNPAPSGQKFPVGSRVKIADDLGDSMSHFPSGRMANVEYTYAHAYGGNDNKSYSLIVDGYGSVAWYNEWQLEIV